MSWKSRSDQPLSLHARLFIFCGSLATVVAGTLLAVKGGRGTEAVSGLISGVLGCTVFFGVERGMNAIKGLRMKRNRLNADRHPPNRTIEATKPTIQAACPPRRNRYLR